MITHYAPTSDGYRIVGSMDYFNRTLYGGHRQDELPEKFFTFAGDQPIVMGTVADWRSRPDCAHAKCGVLSVGVALTPGLWIPIYYYHGEKDGDRVGSWFHETEGTVATFMPGWMEYRISPFFQCFPRVVAEMEVLPYQESDGYLVRLSLHTDQRVHLVLGFGGITGFMAHFEHHFVSARRFVPEDCTGNVATVVDQRTATLGGASGAGVQTTMHVLTSLDARPAVVDARSSHAPGVLLGAPALQSGHGGAEAPLPMLRLSRPVAQGERMELSILVLRNASAAALAAGRELLGSGSSPDHTKGLKRVLRDKASDLVVHTADPMLDLTVAPNVLALDACWHENAFCHGSFGWHCPYMGWRNWYGATVLGWAERVQQAFRTHASTLVREADGPERVVFEGPGGFPTLENSRGFLPDICDGRRTIFYTMQEVGVDMALHSILWTGNLTYAREVFDAISSVLAWEERALDSDGDGLYENWLNTWVSDAHSYNGGACTQSSVYNWRANTLMAGLAERFGLDPSPFRKRAATTREALFRELWLADRGIMAEYRDTVGNRLIHASPELATIYHSIESGIVDDFQAYQMLRFTETDLRNERSVTRGGRLVWSSNWYPQNYSSCGLYTAENLHLAWAYLTRGFTAKGHEILSAVVDSHFLSRMPGALGHCMSDTGYSSSALDFTDIISMHLRTIVEGVFGIRRDLLAGVVRITPHLPADWDHASMETRDVHLDYRRTGDTETLRLRSGVRARHLVELPLRRTALEGVSVRGPGRDPAAPAAYAIREAIGASVVVLSIDDCTDVTVEIRHAGSLPPRLDGGGTVRAGDTVTAAIRDGVLVEVLDPTHCLSGIETRPDGIRALASGARGNHTVFLRVHADGWRGWLPLDLVLEDAPRPALPPVEGTALYRTVDISRHLSLSLDGIHRQEYRSPRPKSYSIMTSLNGRFGWDWNQRGYNAVEVDDGALRRAGGLFRSPSGIPFATPAEGPNVACASVWDNFPESLEIPLAGRAEELAIFYVGITNPMQSRVENGRFEVRYADGTSVVESLVNPDNFDDWLNAPLQLEQESVDICDHNHGIVHRIRLDPSRELAAFRATVVANEVIIGILAVSTKSPPGKR